MKGEKEMMNQPNYIYTPSGVSMYPVMGYSGHPHVAQPPPMPEARDGFQEYGTFSEPNGVLDALAVVAFDPSEELLWTGTHTVSKA